MKEIVLTGVNLGDFGIIDGIRENKFFDLIQALDQVDGIDRIRISSIEPNLLSDEIIEFVSQSNKFVPHFHIPLQSGCNKVLALMRRRYKREVYAERVANIKSLMPDCCIGVDVIVGFPGETQKDFLDTYNFLNELDVSYLHVFTYSEREYTAAAEMKGAVPGAIRAERSKMLHILSEKKRRAFYQTQVGKSTQVLFEADHKNGFIHGFSRNYVKVRAPYDPLLINDIKQVKFENIASDGDMEISELVDIFVH